MALAAKSNNLSSIHRTPDMVERKKKTTRTSCPLTYIYTLWHTMYTYTHTHITHQFYINKNTKHYMSLLIKNCHNINLNNGINWPSLKLKTCSSKINIIFVFVQIQINIYIYNTKQSWEWNKYLCYINLTKTL